MNNDATTATMAPMVGGSVQMSNITIMYPIDIWLLIKHYAMGHLGDMDDLDGMDGLDDLMAWRYG